MARIIRGTRANPGIMDISRRGAEAMVRTAVTHTSNVAREQTYKKNKAITAVQWLSVLDGRTSHICRGRDGTFYPVDKGPRPPAHVACRSTVLGVTKGNARRLEDRETYDQWLRRQSNETQADILGDKKAELFRAGETLDKFVDRSGKEYTLEQLKEADTALWDKAFGD
jgi:SPP1 gp7 family putative phage head morphogenesis protein